MARGRRLAGGLAGVLLALGTGGVVAPPAAVAAPTLDGLGRAVAQALQHPAERAWLRAAMDASPYLEHRVPLRRELAAADSGPVRSILTRAGFGARAASGLPELELYLPVEAHRTAWRGAAGVDVAVRQADGSYLLYSGDDRPRRVPEDYDPGNRVTFTLAPSEIDFADAATALRGGALTGDAMLAAAEAAGTAGTAGTQATSPCTGKICPQPPPPPPPAVGGDTSRHTQMDVLYLVDDHDDPLGGTNEVEIFGDVNGRYNDCGRVTGIRAGYTYLIPARYPNTTLARAVPLPGYLFKLVAYEDDSEACIWNYGTDDDLGRWSTGITLSQYGGSYRTASPGDLVLSVRGVTPFE